MTKHVLLNEVSEAFHKDVLEGLSSDRKTISSKWFYDDAGSHLFDAITAIDAYYPTRTEISILKASAKSYAKLAGARGALVELGSGSSRKTSILLDAFTDLSLYMPIDISANHLNDAAERVRRAYPSLAVIPVAADFTQPIGSLPLLPELPVTVFFPGSTIGNFEKAEATRLLSNIRQGFPGADMIIGADRPKDEKVLVEAYNDPAGVTAAFNLNLLQRMNRELGSDIQLQNFSHKAIWNAAESRIEMHLESQTDQTIQIGTQEFSIEAGETLHTENSHKYSEAAFALIASDAGWTIAQTDTDPDGNFSIYVLSPA